MERVVERHGYDQAVDEACHTLHLMDWALDVHSEEDERVYAVHFDGTAILNDERRWWCKPIKDVWLSVLGAETEIEMTSKQRENYAEWTAKLHAAQAAYALRRTS